MGGEVGVNFERRKHRPVSREKLGVFFFLGGGRNMCMTYTCEQTVGVHHHVSSPLRAALLD
jgi:hypothetical protein